MQMKIDMGSIVHESIGGMKLGVHLLETCRLRKENARDADRLEAEWWEQRILHGLDLLTRGGVSFVSDNQVVNPGCRDGNPETPYGNE
jgi:hypothetical protein